MGVASDAQRLARSLNNPGRFILGPTVTSGSPPYGGVSLGFHSEAEIVWHVEYVPVRDPASGRLVEIGRRGVEWPEIYCLLDCPWDEDAVQEIFSRTTGPTLNKIPAPAEARIEATVIPAVVSAWPPVLFAATDPAQDSIYMRRPVLTLDISKSTRLALTRGAGLPIRLAPTPDGAWATTPDVQICRLENVTL